MVTIKDVAQLAGVSASTVSRALSDDPTIASDSAARVRATAESIGYTLPRARRRSTDRSTRLLRIALVTLGMDRSLARLPLIGSLIQGAQQVASVHGLSIQLLDIPDLNTVPRGLNARQLDGILVKSGLQGSAEQWQTPSVTAIQALPHVWMQGRPPGCKGDVCSSDDYAVGRLAAEHLLAKGHRRLAFLNPKPDHQSFWPRQVAFCWHAEQRGAHVSCLLGPVPPITQFPIKPITEMNQVEDLVEQMLNLPEPPTAIFVPTDSMTVVLYRALAQRGVQIGRDVSVISCNHEISFCAGLHPILTTIDIHAERIGVNSMEHLLWRVRNSDQQDEIYISLAPTLVEGESVMYLA